LLKKRLVFRRIAAVGAEGYRCRRCAGCLPVYARLASPPSSAPSTLKEAVVPVTVAGDAEAAAATVGAALEPRRRAVRVNTIPYPLPPVVATGWAMCRRLRLCPAGGAPRRRNKPRLVPLRLDQMPASNSFALQELCRRQSEGLPSGCRVGYLCAAEAVLRMPPLSL